VLHAGETLEIPRGVVHAMWAGGGTAVRAIWQVRPALRTEEFMAAMAAARGHHATPLVRTAIPLVRKYSDVFRLAGIAGLVQRV